MNGFVIKLSSPSLLTKMPQISAIFPEIEYNTLLLYNEIEKLLAVCKPLEKMWRKVREKNCWLYKIQENLWNARLHHQK